MYYNEALKINPDNYHTLSWMAQIYEELEWYPEAIECYEKYLELRPGSSYETRKIAELTEKSS
jgi:tetratricopeptide (TPR) repeat protein